MHQRWLTSYQRRWKHGDVGSIRGRFLHDDAQPTLASQRSCSSYRMDILALPATFLRSMDPSNYDIHTMQRNDMSFDRITGKPMIIESQHHYVGMRRQPSTITSCSIQDDEYHILWDDGQISRFSTEWVQRTLQDWRNSIEDRIPWTGLTGDQLRTSNAMSMTFPHLLTPDGNSQAIKTLYYYGILLVTGTPINDGGAGIAALGSALGGGAVKNSTTILHTYRLGGNDITLPHGTDGPLRTLYGTVWSTSSMVQTEGSSVADSSYAESYCN